MLEERNITRTPQEVLDTAREAADTILMLPLSARDVELQQLKLRDPAFSALVRSFVRPKPPSDS